MKTIVLPLLLLPALASAQTTFHLGVRGGANLARTTVDPASNAPDGFENLSASKSAIFAWQAGVVGEVAFGKLALQPALLFSQKGEHFATLNTSRDTGFPYYDELAGTTRTNWLELPLNVVYTLHGNHGLQVLAGPYLAVAVGGREQGSETIDYGNSAIRSAQSYPFNNQLAFGPATTNRRLDVGLNFGVGYRQGPVQVQLSYGLGLRNLHMSDPMNYAVGGPSFHEFRADAAYNRVAQLTGTYFFRL